LHVGHGRDGHAAIALPAPAAQIQELAEEGAFRVHVSVLLDGHPTRALETVLDIATGFLETLRGALPEGLPVPLDRQVRGYRGACPAPRQPTGQDDLERFEHRRGRRQLLQAGDIPVPALPEVLDQCGGDRRRGARDEHVDEGCVRTLEEGQPPHGHSAPALRPLHQGNDRRQVTGVLDDQHFRSALRPHCGPAAGEPVVTHEGRGLAAPRGEVRPRGG
jgi:hypothetical protein